MKEGRCRQCGANYQMRSDKMPKAVKCFCESRDFQIIDRK